MDGLHSGAIPGGPQPSVGPGAHAPKTPSKLAKLAGEPSPTSGVTPSKVKAEYPDFPRGARRLGGVQIPGSLEHVQFVEAHDVRNLPPDKFSAAEKDVKKYGELNRAATGMLLRNDNASYDSGAGHWVSIVSNKDYNSLSQIEIDVCSRHGLVEGVRANAERLKSLLSESGFNPDKTGFIHKETGMQVAILYNQDDNELSIAIRGLGNSPKETGFFARLGQVIKDSLGATTRSTELSLELGQNWLNLRRA